MAEHSPGMRKTLGPVPGTKRWTEKEPYLLSIYYVLGSRLVLSDTYSSKILVSILRV